MGVSGSSTDPSVYRGCRGWATAQGLFFLFFVPMLSAALIYEGFVGAPNVIGGLAGIVLLVALGIVLPRVLRGGELAFDAEALTIHTAWSPRRTIRYEDITHIEQFVNAFPVFTFTCPSILHRHGRPILLNDFHAVGLSRGRATRSPKVREAIRWLNHELRRVVPEFLLPPEAAYGLKIFHDGSASRSHRQVRRSPSVVVRTRVANRAGKVT